MDGMIVHVLGLEDLHFEDDILHKLNYRVNVIPIKFQWPFCRYGQADSKIYMETQRIQNCQQSWKIRTNFKVSQLSVFKISHKAMIIHLHNVDIKINGIELRVQQETYLYMVNWFVMGGNWFLARVPRSFNGKGIVYSANCSNN